MTKANGFFQGFLYNLSVILSSEGSVTAKENIEKDTKRPDIAFHVVVLVDDFWCHVVNLNRKKVDCSGASPLFGRVGGVSEC